MEAVALKDEILDAGRLIVGSRDRSPANTVFHDARYRLYSLAARKVDEPTVSVLSSDPEIRAMAQAVFPLSCEAGIYEECAIARNLLEISNLDFGTVYARYYGAVYQALMDDEMAWFGKRPEGAPRHIAYIGGGAMPVPAMLMAKTMGVRVTIVDPHTESCMLAMNLLQRVGLSHLVSVMNCGGEEADLSGVTAVWIANWIDDKAPIFRRIHDFPNVKYAVARSAPKNTLSFVVNDELDCGLCGRDFDVLHTTAKRAGLSLVSLIFANGHCGSKAEARPTVVDTMTDLIGNTPMLRLDPAKTGLKNIELYAKLEHLNPFGSVKDRTAFGMLGPHIRKVAAEGKDVLELSSGNAARALQAIAGLHGTKLETFSGRIRIDEMRKILKLQGATVTPIDHLIDIEDAYSALDLVDKKAAALKDKYFYTDQYRNPANDGTHYAATGREIVRDIGPVDYMIGSVGTAGSTVGISRQLKEANAALQTVGVVSEPDDFIPGIRHRGEIFDIGAFREEYYAALMGITAQDAISGLVDLARHHGVMCGPSSGAAYMAALRYLKEKDDQAAAPQKAVFIVCDRVELYLSYIEARRPDLFVLGSGLINPFGLPLNIVIPQRQRRDPRPFRLLEAVARGQIPLLTLRDDNIAPGVTILVRGNNIGPG